MDDQLKFSLKVILPCGTRFGRGKAELMEKIETLGSISAAAKQMGMSYPRASRLVGEINTMFKAQLIETFQGGATKGGARLTETGHKVLHSYLNWTQNIEANSQAISTEFLWPETKS